MEIVENYAKQIQNAQDRKKKCMEEVDVLQEEEDEADAVSSSSSSASGSGNEEDTPIVKARHIEKEKEFDAELKSHAALDQKLKEAKVRNAAKLAALAEACNSFPSEQYQVSDFFHYMVGNGQINGFARATEIPISFVI